MSFRTVYKAPVIKWRKPFKKPPYELLDQPPSYSSSTIPWPVYLKLQNRFPQLLTETDKQWLDRVRPVLEAERRTLMPLSTRDFRSELRDAALNRGMRRIVSYDVSKVGAAMEAKRQAHNTQVINTNPHFDPNVKDPTAIAAANLKFEDEMVEWLADMSDTSTPVDGAIFWNGINENRLAERVADWNRSFPPGQVNFGQLEATTDVQYVNNKYVWTRGNAYHKYGDKVSEQLGVGASGHVTAVVRWGLNRWSIFTTTELPRMLYIMEAQLKRKETPRMTDLSIIVIEPLGLVDRVKVYTNEEILRAPVWDKTVQGFPASADECMKIGDLGAFVATGGYSGTGKKVVPESPEFLDYIRKRPRTVSPATPRLLRDIDAIVHANQPMSRV